MQVAVFTSCRDAYSVVVAPPAEQPNRGSTAALSVMGAASPIGQKELRCCSLASIHCHRTAPYILYLKCTNKIGLPLSSCFDWRRRHAISAAVTIVRQRLCRRGSSSCTMRAGLG